MQASQNKAVRKHEHDGKGGAGVLREEESGGGRAHIISDEDKEYKSNLPKSDTQTHLSVEMSYVGVAGGWTVHILVHSKPRAWSAPSCLCTERPSSLSVVICTPERELGLGPQ